MNSRRQSAKLWSFLAGLVVSTALIGCAGGGEIGPGQSGNGGSTSVGTGWAQVINLGGPGVAGRGGSTGGGNAGGGSSNNPVYLRASVRRLTNAEYDASVQALLGTTQTPSTNFPPDSRQAVELHAQRRATRGSGAGRGPGRRGPRAGHRGPRQRQAREPRPLRQCDHRRPGLCADVHQVVRGEGVPPGADRRRGDRADDPLHRGRHRRQLQRRHRPGDARLAAVGWFPLRHAARQRLERAGDPHQRRARQQPLRSWSAAVRRIRRCWTPPPPATWGTPTGARRRCGGCSGRRRGRTAWSGSSASGWAQTPSPRPARTRPPTRPTRARRTRSSPRARTSSPRCCRTRPALSASC